LSSFAGSLLLRFIRRHLFIEVTFTVAAAGGRERFDTKIFGDKVLLTWYSRIRHHLLKV